MGVGVGANAYKLKNITYNFLYNSYYYIRQFTFVYGRLKVQLYFSLKA